MAYGFALLGFWLLLNYHKAQKVYTFFPGATPQPRKSWSILSFWAKGSPGPPRNSEIMDPVLPRVGDLGP